MKSDLKNFMKSLDAILNFVHLEIIFLFISLVTKMYLKFDVK